MKLLGLIKKRFPNFEVNASAATTASFSLGMATLIKLREKFGETVIQGMHDLIIGFVHSKVGTPPTAPPAPPTPPGPLGEQMERCVGLMEWFQNCAKMAEAEAAKSRAAADEAREMNEDMKVIAGAAGLIGCKK